jgi:hypothetical protein
MNGLIFCHNKMNFYVIIILSAILLQQCFCDVVNFNDYINVFPSRYFVKIYVDKISAENLESPKIPLTLLKFNTTKFKDHPKDWCKFFPVQGSFIGSRTENTLNLVSVDVNKCHAYMNVVRHEVDHCRILEVVEGRIYDGREAFSQCKVNWDQMITLVIVQSSKILNGIAQKANTFWSTFNPFKLANYMLVFKPSCVNSITLCHFVYSNNLRHVTLVCAEKMEMSVTLFYRTDMFSHRIWETGAKLVYSPNANAIDASMKSKFVIYSEARAEKILTIECLRRANESGTNKYTRSGTSMEEVINWKEPAKAGHYLLISTTQTHFISCYSEPKIQFMMYLQPFHEYVWITLFLYCSFIVLLISVYNRKLNLSKSFSPFFFFISTLVEEPYSVPGVIWNNSLFRTITWTWMLTAMVFTNLYSGIIISDVTAPLPGEIVKNFDQVMNTDKEYMKLKDLDFHQLTNFWLLKNASGKKLRTLNRFQIDCGLQSGYNNIYYNRHYALFRDKNSFALLQSPIEFCHGRIPPTQQIKYISHPWMYSGVLYVEEELKRYLNGDDKAYSKRLVSFFSPRNRHYPEDPKFTVAQITANRHMLSSAIEKELVACGKSIFMGDTKEIMNEKAYLKINYPMKSFYVSEDTFETQGSKPVLWFFNNGGKSKVRYYFQQLIESGVRQGILGLRNHQFYLKRRIGTSNVRNSMPKQAKLGISGSIQTIFIILFGSLSVTLGVFTVEFMNGNNFFRFSFQTLSIWIRNINYKVVHLLHLGTRNLRVLMLTFSNLLYAISSFSGDQT